MTARATVAAGILGAVAVAAVGDYVAPVAALAAGVLYDAAVSVAALVLPLRAV